MAKPEHSKETSFSHSPFSSSLDERSEVAALVPAAGRGVRMGGRRKQFRRLGGAPLLVQTLRALARAPVIGALIVAAPSDALEETEEALRACHVPRLLAVVPGGASRQASVAAALEAAPPEAEIVLVHDAVRPFVTPAHVAAVVEAARAHGAASLAVPVTDTVRRVSEGDARQFAETVPRAGLYRVQTPQAFRRTWLAEAHAAARAPGAAPGAPATDDAATDDAGLVQRLGRPVHVVPGDIRNIKLTTPEDWALAEALWEVPSSKFQAPGSKTRNPQPATRNPKNMRIGYGYDVHRLVEGRPLILGGVEVPHVRGLEGHSDADVLLHAISDALLGAAALGDLGMLFPDTDPQWKDADSLDLLETVARHVRAAGSGIENVDATVALERPKLRPHVPAMRARIAHVLGLDVAHVSVKATTTERMGFVGEEAGAAAHAVCLLSEMAQADEAARERA